MGHKLIALTASKPGKEEAFKSWYRDVHVGEVLAVPGLSNAQVTALGATMGYVPWQQIAVFDLEGDPESVVAEIQRRIGSGDIQLHESIEMTAVSLITYEDRTEKGGQLA